tara:strand:- start:80 stop:628 length:549 start_codon:yes stop_codon:yes gene_type:complete
MSHADSTLLDANNAGAEEAKSYAQIKPTASGMDVAFGNAASNGGSGTYIYMAIRAPMMKEPDAATDVFHTNHVTTTSPENYVMTPNFAPDLCFENRTTGSAFYWGSRLQGNGNLNSSSTAAENTYDSWSWDAPTGDFLQNIFGGTDSQTMVNYLFNEQKASSMWWLIRVLQLLVGLLLIAWV